MAHVERFAPSPTGPLHLGHAFSALTAWRAAQKANGSFLLRIEDNDHTRVRPEYEQGFYNDLHWLGLSWPSPVLRQSDNLPAYQKALKKLDHLGLIYACNCSRSQIKEALPTPVFGPDGMVYPGTCRGKNITPSNDTALRLNMARAVRYLGGGSAVNRLSFTDKGHAFALDADTLITTCGDVVLSRRNIGLSYHLAVVVDDAAQGVTHVTRGMDLFDATQIHRLLQALLGLPTPIYHHHRLILDEAGKRLAKRDDSKAIAKYRAEGATPEDILAMIGL